MSFRNDSIFWVEVEKIVPNPYQPRKEFNEEKLKELAESIRMYGILQPLTVSRKEIQRDDGAFYSEYELIAGERRLRASRLAGLAQVPVIIRDGEQSEQEKLELAIIENLQREDLNAVDRALAFQQLSEQFNLPHAKVAKKVGRSREYVSNSIRLLMLPDYMLDSLRIGQLSEGHARTLLMLNDKPEELDTVYREILLKKLSVREVERIARSIAQEKVRNKKYINEDPELMEIEKLFTETLGTRVQISKTDFGGKLTIDYFSDDDLRKLLMLVQNEDGTSTFSNIGEITDKEVQDAQTERGVLESHTPLQMTEQKEDSYTSPQHEVLDATDVPEYQDGEEKLNSEQVTNTSPAEDEDDNEEVSIPTREELDSVTNGVRSEDLPEGGTETPSDMSTKDTPENIQQKPREEDDDIYAIKNFHI